LAESVRKRVRSIPGTIAFFGLILMVIGVIIFPFAIMTEIGIINFEKESFSAGLPRPEFLIPAYLNVAVYNIVLGFILVLIGGLWSKERSFWLPLVIVGILITIEITTMVIIPMYSPYSAGITLKRLLTIPLWALPGLICIIEGLLLRRFGKKTKIQNI
jgi:hypothetical protein